MVEWRDEASAVVANYTQTRRHTHRQTHTDTYQEGEDGQTRRLSITQHHNFGVRAKGLQGLFGIEHLSFLGVFCADLVLCVCVCVCLCVCKSEEEWICITSLLYIHTHTDRHTHTHTHLQTETEAQTDGA